MNMSYKMHCVLECINNKSCTWDSFCSFVEIVSPCAHYLSGVHSCAKPMVLWCKNGLCPHTWHTSSQVQSHPWFTESSLQTRKSRETWSNTLPGNLLAHHNSLYPTHTSASCSQVSPKGTQEHKALARVEYKLWRWRAVSHSEIKCCKKDFKKHIQDQSLLNLQCCML